MLSAGTALAEEPEAAEGRVAEIVDPYAEPEPRIVDVIDPYAAPATVSADMDLERVCRNYCLARRDALPEPVRRLPAPQQSEEWGSSPEKRSSGLDQQTIGGIVLGVSALAGGALLIAGANNRSDGLDEAEALAATTVGVGLLVGVVLVIDGHDGKTEVKVASLTR